MVQLLSFDTAFRPASQGIFLGKRIRTSPEALDFTGVSRLVLIIGYWHSSTTYKLKINHGDIKATQGDTGHAGPEMVTKVYAHILDEDRKINAQKFEAAFYSNPDMRQIEAQSAQKSLPPATADLGALIRQLQEQPGLASTLAQLLNRAVQGTTG